MTEMDKTDSKDIDSLIESLNEQKGTWANLNTASRLHILKRLKSCLRKADHDSWSHEDALIEGFDTNTKYGQVHAAKSSLSNVIMMMSCIKGIERKLKDNTRKSTMKLKEKEKYETTDCSESENSDGEVASRLRKLVTFPSKTSDSVSTVGMMGLVGEVWVRKSKDSRKRRRRSSKVGPVCPENTPTKKTTFSAESANARKSHRRSRLLAEIIRRGLLKQIKDRKPAEEDKPEIPGKLALVLGVSWPPALFTTILSKLFNENSVVLVKMSAIRSPTCRYYETLFHDFVQRGFVQFTTCKEEDDIVCDSLNYHPSLDTVHLSDTKRVYDRILWGPDETNIPTREMIDLMEAKQRKENKPKYKQFKVKTLDDGGGGNFLSNILIKRQRQIGRRSNASTHSTITIGTSATSRSSIRSRDNGMPAPALSKPITAEVGCISPWIIVPGGEKCESSSDESGSDDEVEEENKDNSTSDNDSTESDSSSVSDNSSVSTTFSDGAIWNEQELEHHAKLLISAVTGNGACNAHNPRVLLMDSEWPHREEFVKIVSDVASEVRPQPVHHPGAMENYKNFLRAFTKASKKYAHLSILNTPQIQNKGKVMKMTPLIVEIKGELNRNRISRRHLNLAIETFFPVLIICTIDGENDPDRFLRRSRRFVNRKLHGTLCCTLVVHPKVDELYDLTIERFIRRLEYGIICINQWAAFAFMLPGIAWGGFQKAEANRVQSGRGWIKNEFQLEDIQKSVVRSPFIHPAQPQAQTFDDKSTNNAAYQAKLTRQFILKPSVSGVLRLMIST